MRMRRLKWLALAMAAVTCCAVATGCSDTDRNPEQKNSERIELLHGFESDAELLKMTFTNMRGKVEVSKEEKYVTQGESAAKMTLIGKPDGANGYYADNEFFITPGNAYLPKVDYSDVIRYTLDVYNDNDRPLELAFGYNAFWATQDQFLFGYRTIEKGMNHLSFEVDRTAVSYFTEVETIKCFSFMISGRNENEDPLVVALDNFVAYTTDEAFTPAEHSANIDFSHASDFSAFTEFGWADSIFTRPRFTKNTDLNYVLYGKNSLKIEFRNLRDGSGISTVGFRSKEDIFGDVNTYDFEKSYFSYDLYNDTDRTLTVIMAVYNMMNESYAVSATIAPHSWSEQDQTRVLLKTLSDNFIGEGLDLFTVTFEIQGLQNAGDTVYLDNLKISVEE